jgi:hypothetical protein
MPVQTDVRFTDIATGGNSFHCGLTGDGRLYCWGSSAPIVEVASDVRLTGLLPGNVCGLTAAGEVYCAGFNQLKHTFTLTRRLPGWTFRTGSFSDYFACGIASDGLAYCTGYDLLGDGSLFSGVYGVLAKVAGQP